jgi:tetratricopeptide (TPR) repeat protein
MHHPSIPSHPSTIAVRSIENRFMKQQIFIYTSFLMLMGLLNPSTAHATESATYMKIQTQGKTQFCVTSESIVLPRFEIDPAREQLEVIQKLMEQGEKSLEEESPSSIGQSVVRFQEVLRITEKFKGRSHWEARAFFQLGEATFALGSFQKALEYYQSALPLMTRFDKYDWNRSEQVKILHGIGKTYRALGRTRQALNSHLQALDVVKRSGGAGNCRREAIAYNYIGEIYADAENPDQALVYFQQALQLRDLLRPHSIDLDPVGIFNNNGKIHFELGDAEKALAFFDRSFQTAERLNKSASITLNRIKADSKTPHLSDQYMLKGVRSELKLGIKQLNATIVILRQLKSKLDNNPELQSRYATKIWDCQRLEIAIAIALDESEKLLSEFSSSLRYKYPSD